MRFSSFARSASYANGNGKFALSEDKVRALAPSVFAEEAHDSRSQRYTYIPTIDVVRGLANEGFAVYSAQQARTRDASRSEHTKHMLRFRQEGTVAAVGDSVLEICLVNSHDGTSAYKLQAGLFRFVCANGLAVGDNWADVRVPHKGDVVHQCIEGTFELVKLFDGIRDSVERMRERKTDAFERIAFATAAAQLRFDPETTQTMPTVDQVLEARRTADQGQDVWSVYNRAQENLIRGGITMRTTNPETRKVRRADSREVKGIDQNLKINRALFTFAEMLERGTVQKSASEAGWRQAA